ncbi:hypothetical protein [Humisphaera borealis]|uniref:Uncharacterized protein n=1 Tax=Humisphaera borealis TaxID=2807512 RepID=A0A7M2WX45_9BACT|nr:hypothetical protein [Humisphaera borealis]QOV89772.1 hypothetical protein IPV69_26920 [Humisphaera borealis]
MPRLLFKVEDTFLIRARGVVLVPGIVPVGGERFRIGDGLRLKRPDGTEVETAIGGLDMFTCTTKPDVPVLLKGLRKEDVPVGTEVWSVDGESAGG